jgi:hypothetical protein
MFLLERALMKSGNKNAKNANAKRKCKCIGKTTIFAKQKAKNLFLYLTAKPAPKKPVNPKRLK